MEPKAIPDKLYYKATEVCQITDTQPYVLRFWESEFPQLASEKNRAGQRVYRKEDIDLILRIKKLLYEEEYTIASARKAIEGNEATIVEERPVRPRRPPVTVAPEILDDAPIVVPDAVEPPAAPASLFEGRERAAETTEAAAVEVGAERAEHHAALGAIEDLKRELIALSESRDAAQSRCTALSEARDAAQRRCRRVADRLQAVLEGSV
ncbi:MAG TPA: MerR family transcriptional regulator [Candidatus Polarisedimenticolaceae bacterium]|nr:MerR family transcriptional regulator [Candidatus Polarisedimenticolaceae bacterium]